MRLFLSGLLFLVLSSSAFAQADVFLENAMLSPQALNSTIVVRDREVSAANTPLTAVYDIGDISNVLVITATCSAGTATLVVSGSSDNANFLQIDSLTAGATNTKQYNNSSTGASTYAVTPLAFRWVKVTVGTCGAANTSTLTVAGK